jgi:hypothetical protein
MSLYIIAARAQKEATEKREKEPVALISAGLSSSFSSFLQPRNECTSLWAANVYSEWTEQLREIDG